LAQGGITAVQVTVLPVPEGGDAAATLDAHLRERRFWLEKLAAGETDLGGDPFRLLPVVRVHDEQANTSLDLRTRLLLPYGREAWHFIQAALLLPPEFS